MPHQNDLSDCHQPIGNLASASNMFSLYMILTYHGICILDAFHFEHAICEIRKKKKKKKIQFNKSHSIGFYYMMKLLKIDTIHVKSKLMVLTLCSQLNVIRVVLIKKNQYICTFKQHEMSSFRWNYIIFMFTTTTTKYEEKKYKFEPRHQRTEWWWVHYREIKKEQFVALHNSSYILDVIASCIK